MMLALSSTFIMARTDHGAGVNTCWRDGDCLPHDAARCADAFGDCSACNMAPSTGAHCWGHKAGLVGGKSYGNSQIVPGTHGIPSGACSNESIWDEYQINKSGKGWPAAAADCLGLTLQGVWKLTSVELVNYDLTVFLQQPWLISFLVVACFLGAEALARARDARKPGDGRTRCALGRASAASPRQKTSLPQLGGAAAPLRPVLMLCLASAANATEPQELGTSVQCLPIRSDEALLDFSGAKPQRFRYCSPPG